MATGRTELAERSERTIQVLILVALYALVAAFCIGVFDLLFGLYRLLTTGRFGDPGAVVGLIRTVLSLAIVVEVHGALVAYLKDGPVRRLIVGVALIAVARETLSFRTAAFGSVRAPVTGALGVGLLLVALGVLYYTVARVGSRPVEAG
ncbi:phosphate-starvation-inducible PsiE family protein [Natronomonas sp.]|uniref:phosphate-starvation-inducible PsiE family protein n=1 Tax=Natronomonas sp. TaxID=2184060 RepID=UPI00263167F5|nr:phosphate-starvation-inducible PsiE family protein [Natronomonas sp.]